MIMIEKKIYNISQLKFKYTYDKLLLIIFYLIKIFD